METRLDNTAPYHSALCNILWDGWLSVRLYGLMNSSHRLKYPLFLEGFFCIMNACPPSSSVSLISWKKARPEKNNQPEKKPGRKKNLVGGGADETIQTACTQL